MKKKCLLLGLAVLLSTATVFAQSGTTGPLTWELNNSTLTISGEGDMPDYSYSNTPWHKYYESIHTVIMKAGVTSIGNYAFPHCWISSVTIPNSVTSIGNVAFYSCDVLKSITIPNSVITIGEEAFSHCGGLTSIALSNNLTRIENETFSSTGLKSITIPNSVTSIGKHAFEWCTALTSVTLYDNLESIGDCAFYACTSLTSITIPNSVTSIGYLAFHFCKSLTSITLPNEVTDIGYATFSYCENLVSVTLPEKLKNIGKQAFEHCTSLTSIVIPNRVKNIEKEAFRKCTNLTSLTLPANLATIGDDVFFVCTNLNLITNLNPVPIDVYPTVFYGVDKSACTLEVPINSVSAYKNANTWKEFNIVGIEVGIETIENNVVEIYPNPTGGQFKFSGFGFNVTGIEIFDVMGKIVQSLMFNAQGSDSELNSGLNLKPETLNFETVINISHLENGIYFLRIQTETGTITRKIVKQ